jgi:hypothetical protein
MEHIQCQHCGNAIPQPQYQDHLLLQHPQDQQPAPQEEKAPVQSQPQENTNGQDLASNQPVQTDNIENPQDIPIRSTIERVKEDGEASDKIMAQLNSQPISPENSKEEKPKDLGGRPCLYCQNKDKYQKIADEYIAWSLVEQKDKRRIPYTEELALKLGHHRESIMNWANNEAEHPQFFDTIKILQTIQALRLQQRTLGRYNPTGAIFLLKANHNFMESEKKILAGDRTEPLTIEIVEETR